jgi:nitric oxide reductase NorQ protein
VPTGSPAGPPGRRRLGSGELRAMVLAHLTEHPGHSFTPGELAHALGGRSTGAIGNALETLVERGRVTCTHTRPRRFAATAGLPAGATSSPPAPAPTPRPARPSTAAPGPVVRPNGQRYHPRALADHADVAALRALRQAGMPTLLYGPPGTGKTALVEAAFPDLVTVAGDGDTAVADLVGEYTQTDDGTYQFVYGPLVVAMTEGRVLFIDDATLISPKVLAVVYPAMDGRRQLTVKAHKGETVTATEGFYVIAGHNPGVHGAVLTEALASRFGVQIHVQTDYDLAAGLKVNPRAVRVARNLASRQHAGEVGWAPYAVSVVMPCRWGQGWSSGWRAWPAST